VQAIKEYYVDIHVHIGKSSDGHEIKRATASDLTFENIAHESRFRKGINVIGVVDSISPWIIRDIEGLMDRGEIVECKKGGMEYKKDLNIILGAEIETRESMGCSAHSLIFFPFFDQVKRFSSEMEKHVKNIRTCCSIAHLNANELYKIAAFYGGVSMPAHAFTPYKSFYGNCCDSLHDIFDEGTFNAIPSIELGLSADTAMASQLSELDGKSFTSNSDAHSLGKMGREYNVFLMEDLNYEEWLLALCGRGGRRIVANYGLNPKLGKYHRSFCLNCEKRIEGPPPQTECPVNNRHKVLIGVMDRLKIIKDREQPYISNRPPYYYQIPLEFLPKVGPKTIDKLIERFGSEMNILHKASEEEIAGVVKEDIAHKIILAREGRLEIQEGGGGIYGKIE
jgi:Uncharacterized conserved protein